MGSNLCNSKHEPFISVPDTNTVSDGYHTFGELYEHRITLFIALCKLYLEKQMFQSDIQCPVYRSITHSDGTAMDGWFLLGMNTKEGQITYHLPISKWEDTCFADTLEKAPEWDGHTSNDVLLRLREL